MYTLCNWHIKSERRNSITVTTMTKYRRDTHFLLFRIVEHLMKMKIGETENKRLLRLNQWMNEWFYSADKRQRWFYKYFSFKNFTECYLNSWNSSNIQFICWLRTEWMNVALKFNICHYVLSLCEHPSSLDFS